MTEYISRRITLSALLVGTLIVGKKYYENWICNKWIKIIENDLNDDYEQKYFIDTLMDDTKNDHSRKKPDTIHTTSYTILGSKVRSKEIQIGSKGNVKKLKTFTLIDDTLVYEFEDKYILTLFNNGETNNITYSFHTPSFYLIKELNDKKIQLYTTTNETHYLQ